jgi:hypothetical protein
MKCHGKKKSANCIRQFGTTLDSQIDKNFGHVIFDFQTSEPRKRTSSIISLPLSAIKYITVLRHE